MPTPQVTWCPERQNTKKWDELQEADEIYHVDLLDPTPEQPCVPCMQERSGRPNPTYQPQYTPGSHSAFSPRRRGYEQVRLPAITD
jgi:hypothetical protein